MSLPSNFEFSDDGRIVQMRILPHKNITAVGVRRSYNKGERTLWKLNKIAISRARVRPLIINGKSYPHPFERRVLSVYDYEELPNINNSRFFHYLTEEWRLVASDYIASLKRKQKKTSEKRLREIEAFTKHLEVFTYVQAAEVLRLMGDITWVGPDGITRRMYNPEQIAHLIDTCEYRSKFGEDKFSFYKVEMSASWVRSDGSESDSRPYPPDVTWDDVESARRNGF